MLFLIVLIGVFAVALAVPAPQFGFQQPFGGLGGLGGLGGKRSHLHRLLL